MPCVDPRRHEGRGFPRALTGSGPVDGRRPPRRGDRRESAGAVSAIPSQASPGLEAAARHLVRRALARGLAWLARCGTGGPSTVGRGGGRGRAANGPQGRTRKARRPSTVPPCGGRAQPRTRPRAHPDEIGPRASDAPHVEAGRFRTCAGAGPRSLDRRTGSTCLPAMARREAPRGVPAQVRNRPAATNLCVRRSSPIQQRTNPLPPLQFRHILSNNDCNSRASLA